MKFCLGSVLQHIGFDIKVNQDYKEEVQTVSFNLAVLASISGDSCRNCSPVCMGDSVSVKCTHTRRQIRSLAVGSPAYVSEECAVFRGADPAVRKLSPGAAVAIYGSE